MMKEKNFVNLEFYIERNIIQEWSQNKDIFQAKKFQENLLYIYPFLGFPGGSDGKEIHLQCRRPGFDPWVGKIPWRRAWQPTPVFLLGESSWKEAPGKKHLVGYSPSRHRVRHDWATKHSTHIFLLRELLKDTSQEEDNWTQKQEWI